MSPQRSCGLRASLLFLTLTSEPSILVLSLVPPPGLKEKRTSALVHLPHSQWECHFSVCAVCQGDVMFLDFSFNSPHFSRKTSSSYIIGLLLWTTGLFHQRVHLSGNISSKIECNEHETSSRYDAKRMFFQRMVKLPAFFVVPKV